MPIDVPNASLDHLDRAPLKVAVAQVRFKPVHAVAKREKVADFEACLANSYEAQEGVAPVQGVRIHFGPAPAEVAAPPAQDLIWPFRDEERGYVVELGASSLSVEADSAYHDFQQFLGEFETAVQAFAEIFKPHTEIRLGLRYVNELHDPRLQDKPQNIISASLLGPIGTAIAGSPSRSFSEVRIDETLGTFVLRHGLSREGATYLLDFDYFAEEERPFDPKAIVSTVEQFHTLIESFFVWSLNADYLGELRG